MYWDLLTREVLTISRPEAHGVGKHFGRRSTRMDVSFISLPMASSNLRRPKASHAAETSTSKNYISGSIRSSARTLAPGSTQSSPYHSSDWNCETFANWITEGKAESSQVNGIAVLAVIAAVAAAAR